jgi:hypothetical protein
MQESVDEYWIADKEKDKTRRMGSNEGNLESLDEHVTDSNINEILRQKMEDEEKQEQVRQQQLQRIKTRHITEFANEQNHDFASVLGLPQVTLKQLYERFDESEPIVIDALREKAYFHKMVEGYPTKLSQSPMEGCSLMGTHLNSCNIIDFYVCMQPFSKFNAALVQSFEDLERETQPEHGFASICLETAMIKQARLSLRQRVKAIQDGIDSSYLKGQELFEEDFYLGCPDALVYLMKRMHMEGHPDNLYKLSDALVISKLDAEVSLLPFV